MEERMGDAQPVEQPTGEAEREWTRTEAVDEYDQLISTVCPKLTFWERVRGAYNLWIDNESETLLRHTRLFEALIGRILALPVRVFAWAVVKYKTWTYDPQISEKSKCPACGYHGVRINFVEMPEQAIQACMELTCNRCSAKHYVPTIYDLKKWYRPEQAMPRIHRGR